VRLSPGREASISCSTHVRELTAMFDAKRLLDQFLGSGGQPGTQGGQAGAQGGQPPAQGGQFDLGGLLSGRTSGGVTGGSGGLGDVLGGLASGGFGKGAAVGGLAGLLLGGKGTRKLAGSAMSYGGLAVAGALA